MRAAEALRDAGLDVVVHGGEASFKAQMKRADASGAEYAVIVGEVEAASLMPAVKALRATSGAAPFAQQRQVAMADLGEAVASALGGEGN